MKPNSKTPCTNENLSSITNNVTRTSDDINSLKNLYGSFVKQRVGILQQTHPLIASVWSNYMDIFLEKMICNLKQLDDITYSNILSEDINDSNVYMLYLLMLHQ